jgi:GTP cyclohydrolase I
VFDKKKIEEGIRLLLEGIGENPDREGLKDTPDRVARMYEELCSGMNMSPKEHLSKTFTCDNENVVIEKDITFYSTCEHHMLPFYGKAHVAYIPNGRVIGLSKIARIADMVSKRLQLQERIGSDIADIMQMITGAKDIAVFIEGCHSCMTARGIKKANTKTYTQTLRGRFNNESNGFVQWWNR